MSTGRRLAKRSIIGTKVLAPGPDGLLYTGTIDHIKSPPNRSRKTLGTKYTVSIEIRTTLTDIMQTNLNDIRAKMPSTSQGSSLSGRSNLSGVIIDGRITQQRANTLLSGNSPAKQASLRRSVMIKEFRESEIYGPGFRDINTVKLKPTQLVFLTYNSRECSGYVIHHDQRAGEVVLRLNTEEQLDVRVPFEDVRLIESRKSARLADQVTDFALLADMGGDRRRTSSHNIDVPSTPQHNNRKRPTSFSEEERNNYLNQCRDDEEVKVCNAALTLMHLSGSPLSPKSYDSINSILASSPGSSSAWSSGSSSPPLSDDGRVFASLLDSARNRTTSLSTSDEGIVVDFNYEEIRRRRQNESLTLVPRQPPPKPVVKRIFFRCTWRGCDYREKSIPGIERHIRDAHIGDDREDSVEKGASSDSEHEEEFYYTEVEEEDDEPQAPSPPSPPTLSHRDMARPPHEDPEYQRKIVGNFKQGLAQSHSVNSKYIQIGNNGANNNQQYNVTNTISIPSSPLAHHNYTWPMPAQQQQNHNQQHHQLQQSQHSPGSPMKHPRCSPRPSTSVAPYPSPNYVHHHYHRNYSSSSSSSSSGSSGAGSPISNNSHIIHQIPHQSVSTNHHQQQQQQQQSLLQPQQQQQQQQQQTQQQQEHHHTPQQQYHQHHHQLMQHNIPSSTTVTISPTIHHTNNTTIHHPQQSQQQQQQHQHPQQQHHPTQQQHYNHQGLHTPSPASITATVTTTTRRPSPNVQKKGTPNSPNRRTRGENKKCRKVYGMERREQWCTQCKWKKACSRFGD